MTSHVVLYKRNRGILLDVIKCPSNTSRSPTQSNKQMTCTHLRELFLYIKNFNFVIDDDIYVIKIIKCSLKN